MAIVWTSDLNTGIEPIDSQHRRIVDYINQLEVAISRQDSNALEGVLDDLAGYGESHFAFEENLQERIGYKFAGPHKAIHQMFIKRLRKYRERHDAGEDVGRQLHDMLTAWLVQHIKREDMGYVPDALRSLREMPKDDSGEDWLSRSVSGFFGKSD